MDSYVSVAEFRAVSRTSHTDEHIQAVLDSAKETIDEFLGRTFSVSMGETRVFGVDLDYVGSLHASMGIDDFVVGAEVDVQVGETPTSDFVDPPGDWWLGPVNPKMGWPYTEFHVKHAIPWQNRYVRVTGDWGWPRLPAPVKRAALLISQRTLQREVSPMGQLSAGGGPGAGEFGQVFVKKVDPDVQAWLRPYKRSHLLGW